VERWESFLSRWRGGRAERGEDLLSLGQGRPGTSSCDIGGSGISENRIVFWDCCFGVWFFILYVPVAFSRVFVRDGGVEWAGENNGQGSRKVWNTQKKKKKQVGARPLCS
jgi:hypothetical protein